MLFLVTKNFCSGDASSISYDSIVEALNRVSLGEGWGTWVGLPRVVRSHAGECAWDLKIARLYEVPGTLDDLALATLRMELGSAVDASVPRSSQSLVSAWGPTNIALHNPLVNDTREYWQSGQASRTRTRDDWDGGEPENPTGPARVLPQRVGYAQAVGDAVRQTGVTPIVIGAAVIITMIYVGPAIGRWAWNRSASSGRGQRDDRDVDFSDVGLKRPRRR